MKKKFCCAFTNINRIFLIILGSLCAPPALAQSCDRLEDVIEHKLKDYLETELSHRVELEKIKQIRALRKEHDRKKVLEKQMKDAIEKSELWEGEAKTNLRKYEKSKRDHRRQCTNG